MEVWVVTDWSWSGHDGPSISVFDDPKKALTYALEHGKDMAWAEDSPEHFKSSWQEEWRYIESELTVTLEKLTVKQ